MARNTIRDDPTGGVIVIAARVRPGRSSGVITGSRIAIGSPASEAVVRRNDDGSRVYPSGTDSSTSTSVPSGSVLSIVTSYSTSTSRPDATAARLMSGAAAARSMSSHGSSDGGRMPARRSPSVESGNSWISRARKSSTVVSPKAFSNPGPPMSPRVVSPKNAASSPSVANVAASAAP